MNLTRRQADLLTLLTERQSAGKLCPTFEEMREHMGYNTKSRIHQLVEALERRGYVFRTPRSARSIVVIGNTNMTAEYSRGWKAGYEQATREWRS